MKIVAASTENRQKPSRVTTDVYRGTEQLHFALLDFTKFWCSLAPGLAVGVGVYLSSFEQDSWNDFVQQTHQLEHGVLRQMLLCKLSLQSGPPGVEMPILFNQAYYDTRSLLSF